jgi:hypothetical protein
MLPPRALLLSLEPDRLRHNSRIGAEARGIAGHSVHEARMLAGGAADA